MPYRHRHMVLMNVGVKEMNTSKIDAAIKEQKLYVNDCSVMALVLA